MPYGWSDLVRYRDAVGGADAGGTSGGAIADAWPALAHRAAWSAFDVAAHEAARSLFRLALYTVTRGGEHDLRAHVLADAAAQQNQLGYHTDALDILRMAEGDERVSQPLRMLLHGVRARTHAALGEADACQRHIEAAEQCHGKAAADAGILPMLGGPAGGGWTGTIATAGRLMAITGHALADLSRQTGNPEHREQALDRLTEALDQLDPTTQTRAVALCAAQRARLEQDADELPAVVIDSTYRVRSLAFNLHSARLHHYLAQLPSEPAPPDNQPAAPDKP